MTCNQCIHKAVCHKEHHATDMEPEHYYYSDVNYSALKYRAYKC